MSISQTAYLRVVRASAMYDLLLATAFGTPWTFAYLHARMSGMNQWLGGTPLPQFMPLHVLVACLMGTAVLVWSVPRIVEPTVRLGRYDGTGRFVFGAWMGWAWLSTGAPVLLLIMIPELAWGIAQCWPVRTSPGGQPVLQFSRTVQ